MDIKRILKNLDWWLIIAVLLLMGCGLGLIDSATHSFAVSTGKAWHVQRQSMFMLFGIVMVAISLAFDYRMLKNYANKLYWFNIILLLAVMFVGHSQLGAQRWIQIGSFTFQPSEFAKAFLIICLAAFMEKRIEWLEEFKDYLPVFGYILVPFVLVMRQPDLGTSLTFIAILVSMIFVSGFKYKWFFRMGVAFVAMLPVFWMILKDYQKNRIRVFLDPEMDPFGRGYHVIQSKIAIGSGGFLGKGWLAGTQSQLNFLPENHTDFIFAVAGEEFGFVGAAFIILLFMIIIWRGIAIALDADDNFGTLLAVGVTGMFMFHILVNIGMTAGIMPVTGVPLPFLSYGVSSLITNLMLVALLLNIKARKQNLQF
ncbi:rod shape-determining protein RodA [Phascolarctobacterium sp.]|uniref:rod shape-determining protein RodA n=1 Tax=Phascolarctobacterium sp. TaxID=2049039 RepID=UPI00386E267B